MRKQLLLTAAAALLCAASGSAVPAKPGLHRLTQPDGTVVEARIVGDEFFHYYETPAGELLMQDRDGTMRPCVLAADGSLIAKGEITGKASSQEIRNAVALTAARVREKKAARVAPAEIKKSFPTTGTVTGLILLCEFQDVKFTPAATVEHYDKLCNERGYTTEATCGSVIDYFSAQSGGKFTPEFDVFGPLTLPYDRAHYGMTNDVNSLFRDAALEADAAGLDFTKYDINNDGFVDFLFVVFAGHGQAQGGPYESVWPAMQDLSEYIFDYFDGLNLGVAACSCELKGGSGTNMDGIGTICHEFSHILGLADIYDTSNQGGHGMGHYDIMDIGTYNDNQITPSGYTAMDKYTLGWIEPTVLEQTTYNVTLEPFSETHQSVFIVNPENTNEYYTLENRQLTSWDAGLPGHGLVISYCHYDPKLWRRNTLNAAVTSGYEHVRIVAADNIWDSEHKTNEAADPYPGTSGNTEFTATSLPGAVWYSSRKPLTCGITNIRESESGTITFDYIADTTGIDTVQTTDDSSIRVLEGRIIAPEGAMIYDVTGRPYCADEYHPGIYIVRTGATTCKMAI